MIANINPYQKVDVVNLTSEVNNIYDKSSLLQYINSLVGKTQITTSDKGNSKLY